MSLLLTFAPQSSAPTPPPFAPTDIANLALWLDASDATTITEVAGLVSQWNDKSGNTRNATQGTGANQATTGTRTINGLNTLDFGGNDYYDLASAIPRADGYTTFIIYEMDTGDTQRSLFSSISNGGFSFNTRPGRLFGIVKQGIGLLLAGAARNLGQPYIAVAATSSAGNALWVDGVADGSNATNPTYSEDVARVGGNPISSLYADGKIAEIIIYTGILSDTNKNLVGNYLDAKWGITWTNI